MIPFSHKLSSLKQFQLFPQSDSSLSLRSSMSQPSSTSTAIDIPTARSIAITEDHLILLYETRLAVVSRVTRQQVRY